jgi:hypothetical protein
MEVIVLDNFLKRPELEREKALKQNFKTVEHNGLKYRGIAMTEDLRNLHRIENLLGVKFKETTNYYRINLENEENETYIHSDILIGSFTAILYLNPEYPKGHGTAFWRHGLYQFESHEPKEERNDDFWKSIYEDGFHEDRWQMTQLVEAKFNRLIIFYSPRYHSRYPMKSFGHTTDEARLIKVYFGKV